MNLEASVVASTTLEGQQIVDYNVDLFARQESNFLNHAEIQKLIAVKIKETFRRGHSTKLFSRKHRERLQDTKILLHDEAKRTYVIVDFMLSKKKMSYCFSTINYFATPRGKIYVYRAGIDYPKPIFFTAHFFDRMIQRCSEKKTRTDAVLEFVSKLHADTSGIVIACDDIRKKGYIFLNDGLGLGHVAMNQGVPITFIMTFISEDMMFSSQRKMWEKYTHPDYCTDCDTNH
jgi:hypothetical protein